MSLEDRFVGSMLGLALSDALGAPQEGSAVLGAAWRLLFAGGTGRLRWTDDTEMAIGLAESLIEHRRIEPDALARRWAERMTPMRGYGPGARRLLMLVARGMDWREANRSVFPDGSFGNGAAMRAGPLGLYYHRDEARLREAAELASSITHAHPLGIEGGLLVARAVALALEESFEPDGFIEALHAFCRLDEFRSRLKLAQEFLRADPWPAQIRGALGVSVVAHQSAVTAVYAFCRHADDFEGMVQFINGLGGDTDTIGAMAGGMFGAKNGAAALPGELLDRLEARDEIEKLARSLYAATSQP